MTESMSERDARRNAGLGDIYVNSAAEPWINFSPGIDFKLLRTSQETGAWTVLFKCSPGSSFARHEHLAAGEYLMVSGKMEIRGGVERGGVTARAGDYGFEANGTWHDETNFPEETILYFTNFVPSALSTTRIVPWPCSTTRCCARLRWPGARNSLPESLQPISGVISAALVP